MTRAFDLALHRAKNMTRPRPPKITVTTQETTEIDFNRNPMPMSGGGGLSSIQKGMDIGGQPHRLAYLNSTGDSLLKHLGGLGKPVQGTKGVPAYIGVGDEAGISEDYGEGGSMGGGFGDGMGEMGSSEEYTGPGAALAQEKAEPGFLDRLGRTISSFLNPALLTPEEEAKAKKDAAIGRALNEMKKGPLSLPSQIQDAIRGKSKGKGASGVGDERGEVGASGFVSRGRSPGAGGFVGRDYGEEEEVDEFGNTIGKMGWSSRKGGGKIYPLIKRQSGMGLSRSDFPSEWDYFSPPDELRLQQKPKLEAKPIPQTIVPDKHSSAMESYFRNLANQEEDEGYGHFYRKGGGGLSSLNKQVNINGEPHRLSYINSKEANILKGLGGLGKPVQGTKGVPAYIGVGDAEGLSEDYSMPSEEGGEHSGSMATGEDYGRAEHALDYGTGREGWETHGSGNVLLGDYARPPGMGPAGKARGYIDPDLDPLDPEHSAFGFGDRYDRHFDVIGGYPTDLREYHQYAPTKAQAFLQAGGAGTLGMMIGHAWQALDHYGKTGHLGGHVSQGASSVWGDLPPDWDWEETDPNILPKKKTTILKDKDKDDDDKEEEEDIKKLKGMERYLRVMRDKRPSGYSDAELDILRSVYPPDHPIWETINKEQTPIWPDPDPPDPEPDPDPDPPFLPDPIPPDWDPIYGPPRIDPPEFLYPFDPDEPKLFYTMIDEEEEVV